MNRNHPEWFCRRWTQVRRSTIPGFATRERWWVGWFSFCLTPGHSQTLVKSKCFLQKEKLAAPVTLQAPGWTGLGPTPTSGAGPSPQYPSQSPLPTPLPTAKSWKGSLGLRGASIGDSSTSSVTDSSDLVAFSTFKSKQDVGEKLGTSSVTLNYQDWIGFDLKKEEDEGSKSLSPTRSWMEALKEVRERSREKKRWSFIFVRSQVAIFENKFKHQMQMQCNFMTKGVTLMPIAIVTRCKLLQVQIQIKLNAKWENAEN